MEKISAPHVTAGTASSSGSSTEPSGAAQSGSLPTSRAARPHTVDFRATELAQLALELGTPDLPLRPFLEPRPATPMPGTYPPDTGTFAGRAVSMRAEHSEKTLQQFAAEALAFLEAWRQAVSACLPPHLQAHYEQCAPNENALRIRHANFEREREISRLNVERKLTGEMLDLIRVPKNVDTLRTVASKGPSTDESLRRELAEAGRSAEEIEHIIAPFNRYREGLKAAGATEQKVEQMLGYLEQYRVDLQSIGRSLPEAERETNDMCRFGMHLLEGGHAPDAVAAQIKELCEYELRVPIVDDLPTVSDQIERMRRYNAAEEKAKAPLAESGHPYALIVKKLDELNLPKRPGPVTDAAGSSLEWKKLIETMQDRIGALRQRIEQGERVPKEELLEHAETLMEARATYRGLLGGETAKEARTLEAGERSRGVSLHGEGRKAELGAWRDAAKERARALRAQWGEELAAEAAVRRRMAKGEISDTEGAAALTEIWREWWQHHQPGSGRSDRPIPVILPPERAISVENGRFDKTCTAEELGIKEIVERYFLDASQTHPGFDLASLSPRDDEYKLRSQADINALIGELAASPAPFHVIGIPGDQDGSFDRSLVIRNCGSPDEPEWQILPRTGSPIDGKTPSYGLARNFNAAESTDAGSEEPWTIYRGKDFPTSEEKRRNPLPNRFGANLNARRNMAHMSGGMGGDLKHPSGTASVLFRTLHKHLQSVQDAGGDAARVAVLSPQSAKAKSLRLLGTHIGHEVSQLDAEKLDMRSALLQSGWGVFGVRLNEQQVDLLRQGRNDAAKQARVLQLTSKGKLVGTFAWSRHGTEDMLVVKLRSNDFPVLQELGLRESEVLGMKVSECIKQIESRIPDLQFDLMQVGYRDNCRLLSMLSGDPVEQVHADLMKAARAESLPLAFVDSFVFLSHVFAQRHPNALAATYPVENGQPAGATPLGQALDETGENLMLEFMLKTGDDRSADRLHRVCFRSPGTQADKNQITGVFVGVNLPPFKGPPSKLLDAIAARNGEATMVSVLSTGALGTGKPIESPPSYVADLLEQLMLAGLPVNQEDEENKRDVLEILAQRYPAPPANIAGEMLAAVAAGLIQRYSQAGDKLEISRRFTTRLPLIEDGDYKGMLIRVQRSTGIQAITFHENNDGAIKFMDVKAEEHPAAAVNSVARNQKWTAGGPVEILQFKGNHIHFFEYDPEYETETDSDSKSSSGRKPVDPAEDTDWEDDATEVESDVIPGRS